MLRQLLVVAVALALVVELVAARIVPDRERQLPVARSQAAAPALPSSGPLVGDAHLRGTFDMTAARTVGGRVRATMHDGRVAVLTLDAAIQRTAERVLKRAHAHQGAVVVMTVDGTILALAGRAGAAQQPGLATQTWAPAASVFKLVTTATLLSKGTSPTAPVCYHGGYRAIEASHMIDDPIADTRCDDLGFALAHSQNAIIGKLVLRDLNAQDVRAMARALGLQESPSFALSAAPGRVAVPDRGLALARVASGFWQTELSTLGGALLAATIASGGLRPTPRIVDAVIEHHQRSPITATRPQRVLPQSVTRAMTPMMVRVTDEGTARGGFFDRRGKRFIDDDVAGKTGTLTRRSPSFVQYSWFVGFAPAHKPRIVIAVLLANRPRWRFKAYTAARMILARALNADQQATKPHTESSLSSRNFRYPAELRVRVGALPMGRGNLDPGSR